ncbi:MAG: GIY-YIG nuclease family protein [bacterium]|nr:GIY-YIG nuclease family protein [bacterium]
MNLNYFKKNKLPDKPGVYFFKGKKGILYIGKATSLKDRVKSYFGKDLIVTRGPLLLDMVFKADKIEWAETDSVLEALILEANLIKKHQPYYNTKEKDDKSFNYVCISKDELPKILVVRGKNLVKNNYSKVFGPFTNGGQLKEGLRIIRRVFPFMDEKTKNYYEFYRQLNLAPNLEKRKEYLRNIKHIILFLEGKKKNVVKKLEKEMLAFSKSHEFEKAGGVKRQIFAIRHINDIALIKSDYPHRSSRSEEHLPLSRGRTGGGRIEAYDIAHMSGKNMVGVMTVVEDAELVKHEYKKFKIRTQTGSNDTGALAEVLERRFAHNEWAYPKLIVVDGGVAQINTAKKVLAKYGIMISIVSVLKDERHRPKNILGDKMYAKIYEKEILLVHNEAHRFAITYHKKLRGKIFLK